MRILSHFLRKSLNSFCDSSLSNTESIAWLHRPKRKIIQNKWLKENNITYISWEEQIKRRSLFISWVLKTEFLRLNLYLLLSLFLH
jgi:hypothetical protein